MKSLRYLNKYFVKYKWRLLLGLLFIVTSNYFGVRMTNFVGESIDDIFGNFEINTFQQSLILAAKAGGIYLLLSICSGIFLFLTRQTIIICSRLIEFDLKNEIYAHYQKMNFSFFKKNNTGDLMNRISEDVSQVRMYLGPGIMYSINLVVLFTMCLIFMLRINPTLTLYVLLPLPLMSFLIYKVSSTMGALSKKVQQQQSKMSTIVQETFSGIRVIKAYSRNGETIENFNENTEEYKKRNLKLVLVNALFMPVISTLIGLSTILVIYIGGKMHIGIPSTLTKGEIITFIFYVNKLTWPFASIGWVTSIIQRADASQERINEFLNVKPDIQNNNNDEFVLQGDIEFRNVSFTYPSSGIQAIKNLSFHIKVGETYAILGRTGSGKSTILNLLMRQVEPQKGEILIDGKNLKDLNLDDFRNQTGIVPQEVYLFSESIKENIQFGVADRMLSQEEIEDVAKKAHVYHNIIEFPEKFETILGERGVNLSGGQKQRISIARALVRKPKLLILDDCLSAVDTETEEIILRNLKNTITKNTSLIVSHRISSIRNADKILVLEDGNKAEEGSHAELLKYDGIYKELYLKQLHDNEEVAN